MKSNFLCLLSLLIIFSIKLFAQQPTPSPVLYSPQTLENLKKIQTAALQSDYAYRQTAYLSNNIGARLSGSDLELIAIGLVEAESAKAARDISCRP